MLYQRASIERLAADMMGRRSENCGVSCARIWRLRSLELHRRSYGRRRLRPRTHWAGLYPVALARELLAQFCVGVVRIGP